MLIFSATATLIVASCISSSSSCTVLKSSLQQCFCHNYWMLIGYGVLRTMECCFKLESFEAAFPGAPLMCGGMVAKTLFFERHVLARHSDSKRKRFSVHKHEHSYTHLS